MSTFKREIRCESIRSHVLSDHWMLLVGKKMQKIYYKIDRIVTRELTLTEWDTVSFSPCPIQLMFAATLLLSICWIKVLYSSPYQQHLLDLEQQECGLITLDLSFNGFLRFFTVYNSQTLISVLWTFMSGLDHVFSQCRNFLITLEWVSYINVPLCVWLSVGLYVWVARICIWKREREREMLLKKRERAWKERKVGERCTQMDWPQSDQ